MNPKNRLAAFVSRLAPALFAVLFAFGSAPALRAGTATVTVNFTSVQKTLSPVAFSMDESGYGSTKLANDTAQQAELALLDVAMMRMNLGYLTPGDPNSTIVCMASGADHSITGTQWINAIKATGATPQIRVQMNVAYPQSTWVTDAANMVRYFNITTGNRVDRWVIGNEPSDNGLTNDTYSTAFVAMFNAMKQVDPTIKIGGPASATYNTSTSGFLKSSLQMIHDKGGTPDFADFHSYGAGSLSDAALLAETATKYESNPNDLRSFLITVWGASVGGAMPIEIGEWNLATTSNSRQLQHYASVWAGLAVSHMVKAGVIERFYCDKNGLTMGALVDTANPTYGGVTYTANPDDPMPAYHGIGMFTGEGLFPGFGASVVATSVTSSTGLIDAAASDGPKNIVVINSSPTDTTNTTFSLTGVTSASVAVWQKNSGNQSVQNLGTTTASGGAFSYSLAPYTVTTFVVTPTSPPPAPTNLTATAGNAQVALAWSASSGATSYNVKRSTTNGGPYTTVGSPTTTSFTDTGLTNGTTYYYVVTAVNGSGESGNSNQASATPTGGGGSTITIECETLSVGASSGQTWRTSTDSNASGGAIAFYDATAVNNYVTLMTPSITAGSYEVHIITKTANTRGTYQLAIAPSLNGTYANHGSPQDQYSASQVYQVDELIGVVTFGSTSTKAFRFTVTGKNAASSGYGLALDAIKLIPQ